MSAASPNIDALLAPLLVAPSEAHANELVAELIATHAEPVIKGIIRYKLHLNSSQQAEFDDLLQDVMVQLLRQVQKFRAQPDAHSISDLRGLAAVIAHRSCSQWMRKQFPERHAFKNRLHYLLTRQKGLALWTSAGRQLAGFAVWESNSPTKLPQKESESSTKIAVGKGATPPLASLVDDKELQTLLNRVQTGEADQLAPAIARVFQLAGGPIEFEELVGTLAMLLGVRDQPIESIVDDEDELKFEPTANEPDPAWQLEKRTFLTRLWAELKQLPQNQRVALLLNLKDASGNGCITLFPATGVATLREIAAAVEMELETFIQLWNELPLEDARIAELLNVTRQQVINARKSGRERLARRLKGFF